MSAAAYVDQASPRSLPKAPVAVCGLLALVGVVSFIGGLASDPATAWRAFHVNTLFFGAMSQGGLIIAVALYIVGAKWAGPVKRIAESVAAFVPVTFVLSLIGWFGGADYVYPWLHSFHGEVEAVPWKDPWLNPARLAIVDLGILALLSVLTVRYLKASLRPALHGVEATGFAGTMIARWTADWKGEAQEAADSADKLRVLAPWIALIYAFGYSVIAFDQIMSLEPTWFSNLFGAYFAWGGFLSAISLTTVLAVFHRNYPGFEGQITQDRLHDLGKMIFAFSIFWMYLFFSQYLVIWYGNLPEETFYFRERLGPQFVIDKGYSVAAWARAWSSWDFDWRRLSEAYGWTSMIVWAFCWIIPFWVLLGQKPKKTPYILGPVAAIVLVGLWIERNLLVWPAVVPDGGFAWLGAIQIGIALGFLGAFSLVYLVYSHVFPSLAVSDTDGPAH